MYPPLPPLTVRLIAPTPPLQPAAFTVAEAVKAAGSATVAVAVVVQVPDVTVTVYVPAATLAKSSVVMPLLQA